MNNYNNYEIDNKTASLLLERSEKGFEMLRKYYTGLIIYNAKKYLDSYEDIEDCIQDVLITVWSKIEQFDPDTAPLHAWITKIAQNTAKDILKDRQRHDHISLDYLPYEPTYDGPEKTYIQNETRREVHDAIDILTPAEKRIIEGRYFTGETLSAISESISTTVRGVEGKLYRAKNKLRNALAPA